MKCLKCVLASFGILVLLASSLSIGAFATSHENPSTATPRTVSTYEVEIPAGGKQTILTVWLRNEMCAYGCTITSVSVSNPNLLAGAYDYEEGGYVLRFLEFENGVSGAGFVSGVPCGTVGDEAYTIELYNAGNEPIRVSGSVYYYDY